MEASQLIQSGIAGLIEGQDLTRTQAREIMGTIMEGAASPAQIGALLTALRIKGRPLKKLPASPKR